MPQSIPPQDFTSDDILTVQTSFNNNITDGDRQNSLEDKHDIFDSLSWSADTVTMPMEQSQVPPVTAPITTSANTTTELPPLLTLLLPMMNAVESNPPPPPPQPKPPAIIFSSNNGVIDDPLIQSLAAEQAASAHNYDLLSHRHKRVSY
jgi:hypothetical protein